MGLWRTLWALKLLCNARMGALALKTIKKSFSVSSATSGVNMNNERLNGISQNIIGAAIAVHRVLGPGLLESAYEACLVHELVERGMIVERQKSLPVIYKGTNIDCGYRIDLLVEEEVIVELKAVDKLMPIHSAQLVSYLKLSGCKLGLLINFNVTLLKTGIIRLINGIDDGFTPEVTENAERGKNAE